MFLLEVPRLLQTIEIELITLSVDRSVTKVNNLLRAAHSIEGCASSLGLTQIQTLAHQIEDIFRVLHHPELAWNRELEGLLLEIYDCLAQHINALITDKPLPTGIDAKTQLILADLDRAIGDLTIGGQPLPEPISGGVDRIRSIFEVDVAQSLARLERVLIDPACADIVVGEFRAQAEVFTGIAELVNLPGFGSIAHGTIAALDRHPTRSREICCFALVDFYAALVAVLNGDRHSGGTISSDLAVLLADAPPIETNSDRNWSIDLESQTGADSFDLEDLFDRPVAATDLAILPFDLIADFLEDSGVRHSESEIHPLVTVASEDGFDWLIEDLLTSSVIPASIATTCADLADFDLVDIFDLSHPSDSSRNRAVCSDRQFELRAIVAQIVSSFDRLSPVSQTEIANWNQTSTIPKLTRPKKSRKINPTTTSQLTIRVALDRLERMNNYVSELGIEGNGLALSVAQTQDTLRELRAKCASFQTIADRLRQFADRGLIDPRPSGLDSTNSLLSNELNPQFDNIELDRYDELDRIAQATIEQIAQIEEQIEDLSLFTTQAERQIDRQKQLFTYLSDDLMWARMLPLSEILNRFPRIVHDLSVKYHKPVDLKITGAGVLVDRAVIEKLLDPLVHILRNAFDHGIDPITTRQAAGKPDRGLIEINAYHQGSQTIVEVRDDGGGIDLDRIEAKAISLGLIAPDARLTAEQILDHIFTPGFSTAAKVTELSGRGMGLDIVKAQIQAIKGTISIQSQLGQGTTFTIRIPLTLTIAHLTICEAGKAIYAFPTASIQRIVVPTLHQIQSQADRQVLTWHNLKIPIYNLSEIVTYSIPVPERTTAYTLKTGVKNPSDWLAPILLIRTGERVVGLQIDRTLGERELTLKPFGKAVTPASYSYGCTILDDGSILPVLDPHTLIRITIDTHVATPPPLAEPLPWSIASALILVIDDSVTIRQSLCLTLEKYGYRTLQAKDGEEALQLLREKVTEIKLAICDVEMPNINGFEFLNIRRQDPHLTHIPVVMLTSRSNTKHRQFAMHLGAIDYFIKPYVETTFISAIEKLV